MYRIAEFFKVSEDNFVSSCKKLGYTDSEALDFYKDLPLPRRATSGSAGYDFYLPYNLTLEPNMTVTIPTGIRAKMEEGWVLQIFPRSSLGFKFRLQLNNTVGIIDKDYFYSDNEGHIFCKITNDTKENKTLVLEKGVAFVQGIFTIFGVTLDDDVTDVRNGGMGSTTK